MKIKCPFCRGWGEGEEVCVSYDEIYGTKCTACEGKGFLDKEEVLEMIEKAEEVK